MSRILMDLPQLASQDRAILDQLSMTAFVTTASGQLRAPTALYDPRSVATRVLVLIQG